MDKPARVPLGALTTMMAVAADVGFVVLLWCSSTPIVVKIAVSGVLLNATFGIVCFQLGRRFEWKRQHKAAQPKVPA